jgi:hypothetical protein
LSLQWQWTTQTQNIAIHMTNSQKSWQAKRLDQKICEAKNNLHKVNLCKQAFQHAQATAVVTCALQTACAIA